MRIGYFGGSFDPPHRGHLAAATAAMAAYALDTVLFVPTGSQPLKPDGPTAKYADRVAMVERLCADEPRFVVSRLEEPPGEEPPAMPVGRPDAPGVLLAPSGRAAADAQPAGSTPNYTVDTLLRLRSQLVPGDAVFLLLGVDAFRELPRWRSPERLFELAEFVLLSRPKSDPQRTPLAGLTESLTAAQRARVHLLDALDDPSASSTVRAALAGGPSNRDAGALEALTPEVLRYIREHHLYRR